MSLSNPTHRLPPGREGTLETPIASLIETHERLASSIAAREELLAKTVEETGHKVAVRRAFAAAAEDLNQYIQVQKGQGIMWRP